MRGQKKAAVETNDSQVPFADKGANQESEEWELESPFKQKDQGKEEKKQPPTNDQPKVLDSKTIQSVPNTKASNGANSETQIKEAKGKKPDND